MLIGLVRDSVLRCFCQSCSVNSALTGRRHMSKKPIKKTNKKPKCKQPKKARRYHANTEIRCEEKSRGGMCYEVILAEPVSDKPSSTATSPKPKTTVEDINMKLLQAEERRKSMEASRLATVAERLAKLEEAGKKREEVNEKFIAATKVALNDKLDTSCNNREAYLLGLKAKVSDHLNTVNEVRKQLETQTQELQAAIETKMTNVEENRNENMRKMLDKLREHEEYSKKVRLGHDIAISELDKRILSKLEVAKNKRETERLRKLESLREHERRAELVRANRERLMAAENNETASSG